MQYFRRAFRGKLREDFRIALYIRYGVIVRVIRDRFVLCDVYAYGYRLLSVVLGWYTGVQLARYHVGVERFIVGD